MINTSINPSENSQDRLAIKKKILSLADEYANPIQDFSDDALILELGILDSRGILELIAWYESHFEITLEDHEINVANLGTINGMVEFALLKQKARSK